MTRCHQPHQHQLNVPITSSENIEESYLARLSAVGAKTIHPQGGTRLEYKSLSRLSCEGVVVSKAARKGLGGGRCIKGITRNDSLQGNHSALQDVGDIPRLDFGGKCS